MTKKIKTVTYLILAAMLVAGLYLYTASQLPQKYYTFAGDEVNVRTSLPVTANATDIKDTSYELDVRFMGIIPIREINVEVLPETMLIPGGETFGVKFHTDGVIVVGFSEVESIEGKQNPAFDAGIRTKDIIVGINGEVIGSNEDIAEIISKNGNNSLVFSVKRRNLEFSVNVTPLIDLRDNGYKVGLLVRDSTAGIGTITYINPVTNTFAGLGHGICDIDTGELMPLRDGSIFGAQIDSIRKGEPGVPGELKGIFLDHKKLGNLYQNSTEGVFGYLSDINYKKKPLKISFKQDIIEGAATILCTTEGTSVSEYDIKILKIFRNTANNTKNMLIEVTDSELLEKTGGIVQGMSGSPILQNGKIVGAVTHVLVNEPKKGYGIFIENMLEAGNKKQ